MAGRPAAVTAGMARACAEAIRRYQLVAPVPSARFEVPG
jgi:hypothetical protein